MNLTATFAMCQLAGKRMLEQGRGKIVNIASMGSYIGSVNVPAYVASKGGVVQLTKALSNEWSGARGVRQRDRAGIHAHRPHRLSDAGRDAQP